MFNWRILLICLTILTSAFSSHAAKNNWDTFFQQRSEVDGKIVLGRIEHIFFEDIPLLESVAFPGKIDTGADTTSMHADNIQVTTKISAFKGLEGLELLKAIGKEFNEQRIDSFKDKQAISEFEVSFSLIHPYTGETIELTRPLSRLSIITSRSGGKLYRPVIDIPLRIAGTTVNTEVNLTDRSSFSYPILIGKTYLKDTAWVDSGFDYLQEQGQAKVIGRKEHAWVSKVPVEMIISFIHRHSMLHAIDVKVNEEQQRVSFTLEGSNDQQQKMDLPLIKMRSVRGKPHPMVYIPLNIGALYQDAEQQNFQPHILVTLEDRSKRKSQLRLGSEALNQYFIVDLKQRYASDKPLISAQHAMEHDDAWVIGATEQINIDGINLLAEPSVIVKTPVLKVNQMQYKQDKKQIQYEIRDQHGELHVIRKNVERRVEVGDEIRPIVEAEYQSNDKILVGDLAISPLNDSSDPAKLLVSAHFSKVPLLVDARAINLQQKGTAIKAGYIEQVSLEGLQFPVKLDTGADMSSLHATDIEWFKKGQQDWVNFTYSNHYGDKLKLSKPVVRTMKVKARVGETSQPRPIVKLSVKLGDIEHEIDVNLQDRSDFSMSMILGKNFLQHDIIVSSDQQYILTKSAQ